MTSTKPLWPRRVMILGIALTALFVFLIEVLAHVLVDAPNKGRGLHLRAEPGVLEVDIVRDGLHQRGYLLPPTPIVGAQSSHTAREPIRLVVVLHGIRDPNGGDPNWCRPYVNETSAALCVALRGHGRSEGHGLTYGVFEAEDTRALISSASETLRALGHNVTAISVDGPSYGGAVAARLALLDRRIDRVALRSTFTGLPEIAPIYGQNLVGVSPPSWLVDLVLWRGGVMTGAQLSRVNTLDAIRRSAAHFFIMHGEADRDIPVEHGRALLRACRSRPQANRSSCDAMFVPARGHNDLLNDAPAAESLMLFLLGHSPEDSLEAGSLGPTATR